MATRQMTPEMTDEEDVIDLSPAQHALIRDLFDEVEQSSGRQRAEAFERPAR
ncbi:hypothetical protein [Nonomuraea roseola]|uniref:Uncharacterized protein n=1 Tax=Nonomuraea roseola TaxID=46179 RepID=A0ABV5Q8D9_9ACTN